MNILLYIMFFFLRSVAVFIFVVDLAIY